MSTDNGNTEHLAGDAKAAPDTAAVETIHTEEPAKGEQDADESCSTLDLISISLVWGKNKYDIETGLDTHVQTLKRKIEALTGVKPAMQKLMYKGLLKDDLTLREAKVTNGAKIMLIGCTVTDIVAVNAPPNLDQIKKEESKAAASREPLSKQKPHTKVIEKGVPEDAMPGIRNVKDPLPDMSVSGMVNKSGGKVRLTFKLEVDQLWIGTKERTEKIPMNQIKDVLSEPISGHEEYHIMALQLGPTEASRYWIYWVPAQFVDAIRRAILGG